MTERRSVIAVALICGSLIVGSIVMKRRPAQASSDVWYEGASGFATASRLARESGAPMLLYFHTDWCGYCKRMERELFPAPAVEKQLRTMLKVRLNPERSGEEQGLGGRYGVRGYPSLFVERNGSTPERVQPFVQLGGAWSQVSPDEFVTALRAR
jgi:thiol:disulfide interchange protein